MIIDDIPNELMVYGTLFSLTNRIQSIGDGVFSDISIKQHFVLMVVGLFNDKNPSLKDVADIVGCTYQNIKKLAIALEAKGYLKIERDSIDKRRCNLIKMEKVKTISDDMDKEIKQFLEIIYKGITQKQLLNSLNVLKQMDQNLQELQQNSIIEKV